MNFYGVNNNISSSSSYLMEEEDDEIVRSTNLKKQTIPVLIYYIEKQLEFLHNEIKEINNRLEIEILSSEEKGKKERNYDKYFESEYKCF
jgi:tRNA A37 threonylcarbamoyladenosine dehydratase